MVVKANQKTLRADLIEAFQQRQAILDRNGGVPPVWLKREEQAEGVSHSYAQEVAKGHGRIEEREAWAISDPELNAYLGSAGTQGTAWPHLAQIVRVKRKRTIKGRETIEEVYLITSLSPQTARASHLLAYNRSYWGIENQLHWVRDETFGEDRSQVRSGSAPQVIAALRNLTLTLLRWKGEKNIAAALRTFAARPKHAVTLVLSASASMK